MIKITPENMYYYIDDTLSVIESEEAGGRLREWLITDVCQSRERCADIIFKSPVPLEE